MTLHCYICGNPATMIRQGTSICWVCADERKQADKEFAIKQMKFVEQELEAYAAVTKAHDSVVKICEQNLERAKQR